MAVFNTSVLGGLPVTISYELDTRHFCVSVKSYEVVAIKGRKCKKDPNWIYKRMMLDAYEEDLFEKIYKQEGLLNGY